MKMKTEELRIAIAEACGWKPEVRKMYAGMKRVKGWGLNTHLELGHGDRKFKMSPQQFPSYETDLNAMHEAANYLRNKDRMAYLTYGKTLENLVARYNSLPGREAYHSIATCDAPADMRVEAFLIATTHPPEP
jgi:hypothetical protein